MKKKITYLIYLMAALIITASGLGACKKKSAGKKEAVKEAVKAITPENAISSDREYMFLHYKADYRWYESCILMKDYMDEECDGEVAGVSNIFQVVTEWEQGYDTQVVMSSHTAEASQIDVKEGFWVEDQPMNDANIRLTFKQAFDKAMQANCPKPHSRHCVLRKEVGPKEANPQYIFGNSKSQLYVDAATGEVSEHNPVFVGGPLGEWP